MLRSSLAVERGAIDAQLEAPALAEDAQLEALGAVIVGSTGRASADTTGRAACPPRVERFVELGVARRLGIAANLRFSRLEKSSRAGSSRTASSRSSGA